MLECLVDCESLARVEDKGFIEEVFGLGVEIPEFGFPGFFGVYSE